MSTTATPATRSDTQPPALPNPGAPRIVIAGGSGFIGLALCFHLTAAGYQVVVLSRSAPRRAGPWTHVRWDGHSLDGDWASCLDGAVGLINLTGRSVDCIKTPDNQDQILRSRVEPTLVLGKALRLVARPPRVWVQMSTAHIHGDPETGIVTEGAPTGYGFAPEIGRRWEEAYQQAVLPAQRQVILRTSFVIGCDRGAGASFLERLARLARFGLGGRVASGLHGISWIHEHDLCRLFERALRHPAMQGIYIASAPNPVSQAEFMRELRRVSGGLGAMGVALPAPAWLAKLGARFVMRTDPDLALYGRYVSSQRLRDEGFEFTFPMLREALGDLYPNARRGSERAPRVISTA